jgi:hypothetical protein
MEHAPQTDLQTLEIELEDAGSTSWWAGVIAILGSQNGSAFMRFVGRLTGEGDPGDVVARGGPFARPRSLPDDVLPDERWCPGMTSTLEDLQHRLEEDGWTPVGHGRYPWSVQYSRPRAAAV